MHILLNQVAQFTRYLIPKYLITGRWHPPWTSPSQESIFTFDYFSILPDPAPGPTSIQYSRGCGLFARDVV